MEETLYFTLSGLIVVLGVLSVFAARSAMQKGLTYSALAAVVWTLSILVVARAWHALYEIFALEETMGEIPEMAEYVLYAIAYSVFILLVRRAGAMRGFEDK